MKFVFARVVTGLCPRPPMQTPQPSNLVLRSSAMLLPAQLAFGSGLRVIDVMVDWLHCTEISKHSLQVDIAEIPIDHHGHDRTQHSRPHRSGTNRLHKQCFVVI